MFPCGNSWPCYEAHNEGFLIQQKLRARSRHQESVKFGRSTSASLLSAKGWKKLSVHVLYDCMYVCNDVCVCMCVITQPLG